MTIDRAKKSGFFLKQTLSYPLILQMTIQFREY